MPDDLSPLDHPVFSTALDDLDDLLSQSGRAFLVGAGCSKCAGLPLTGELTDKSLASARLDATTKVILAEIQHQFAGAPSANIEDFLSELVDLLAIADRRTFRAAAGNTATLGGNSYTAVQLKDATEQIKWAIADVMGVDVGLEIHSAFVRAVHRPLRPGRSVVVRPVDYLVLNYDALIESALALEKLRYADGLSGGKSAWWDPLSFQADGLAARVIKLHGSIDWIELPGDPLPRRICKTLKLPPGSKQTVLIWPASTKYRETQRDPYAQLSDIARRALRPQSGSQTVLTICGYSFGDSHINLEIERALRESSRQLTAVIFTGDNEPSGDLKRWHEDETITDQVRIHAKRGFFHGTNVEKSAADLPWWKFENITRLLGGER
jgi:hypothetical protein